MKETSNWLNGKALKAADPSWGMNRAFLYGESVFTTMLIDQGKIRFLEDHLKRLTSQVSEFYSSENHKIDSQELTALIEKDINSLDLTEFKQGRLRITIFFSDDRFRLENLNRLLSISPIENVRKEVTAKSFSINDLDTRSFKLGNYASMFYLRRNLNEPWNDLCLINQNKILEFVSSNVFFIHNDKVYFPKYEGDFLYGIVFQYLQKALGSHFEIKNEVIMLNQLKQFDCCFATNSIQSIIPVKQIDQYYFKNSCLGEIQKIWSEYVQENH